MIPRWSAEAARKSRAEANEKIERENKSVGGKENAKRATQHASKKRYTEVYSNDAQMVS